MTNEKYLQLSFFLVVIAGLLLAILILLLLRRGHRELISAPPVQCLGALLKHFFPMWLVTAVILGFLSVSYFDCGHHTYTEVIAQRDYLVEKNQEQLAAMFRYLAAALVIYGLILTLYLWGKTRSAQR